MNTGASTSWLVPISALLGATFAVVSAELMISGLLPAIAKDVGVDIPTAGLLISSLRDKDQLAVSGWWTALSTSTQNLVFRAPGADAQRLLQRVIETGAPVQRFELVQPSLHQIFLERVGATGIEEGIHGNG